MGKFVFLGVALLALCSNAVAQQAQPSPSPQASPVVGTPQAQPSPAAAKSEAKAPVVESTNSLLLSARKVLVTRVHGSNIPFDVMSSALSAWPQFTLVDSQEKADIVVSVETTGESEVQISGGSSGNPISGQTDRNNKVGKDISSPEIRVTVFSAHNKRVLWTSTEKVKFAVKKTTRETYMVEAAEQLASRFHDRLDAASPRQ
jgi:hypothetical protein